MMKKAAVILAGGLLMVGCSTPRGVDTVTFQQPASRLLRGHVSFAVRTTQATLGEIANGATVSLIDAGSGNTIASSVTDGSGNFVLTFSGFTPVSGAPYYLEAVKGLSVGGSQNRAGASAARLRTLLFWNNGWQSLTNSTQGVGIVVSTGTTALCAITSLKATPTASLSLLVNTVNGSTGAFVDGSAGLSNANDYQPVLGLVSNAVTLDQDPIAEVSYNPTGSTYYLETGIPVVTSVSPTIGTPGGNLIIKGAYLDKLNGRNAFWFGTIPASTWSVSADRTQATVSIPTNAYSAPFTLQQPNGVVQTLNPFLFLHGTVGTLAGNGSANYADGTGINAEFNHPDGLAIDANGNLYVGDTDNHRIRRVTPSGQVTTLAGSGTPGLLDGSASAAQFRSPWGVAVDGGGNVYVGDTGNNVIRRISAGGVVTTYAGTGTAGFNDGATSSAMFSGPLGVALDASGNLYVADQGNQRIRRVTPSGVVSTVAGNGVAGALDGVGTSATFYNPEGVVCDTVGNLYVADRTNNKIRKIVLATQAVSTLAGSGTAGYADGTGTAAMFNSPADLGIDSLGNLFVGDTWGYRVRKVTSAGVVTTLAGTGQASLGDGAAASATFNNTVGIAVDGLGNVFVADWANQRIRVVTP